MKLDSPLSPRVKTNSKWIKDFNVRPKTLNLLQEKIGKILQDINIGKDFLTKTQGSQEIIATADKCVRFSSSKDEIQKRDKAEPSVRFTRTDKEELEGKPQPALGGGCVFW